MELLQDQLCGVKENPSKFACNGAITNPSLPDLHIKDVGEISVPLLSDVYAKEITDALKNESIDQIKENRYFFIISN